MYFTCLTTFTNINLIIVNVRTYVRVVGLYEFLYVFMPESESEVFGKIAGNLLTSLPNDDDLELTFRNDRRAHLMSRLESIYQAHISDVDMR